MDTLTFNKPKSQLRTIRPNDVDWLVDNGLTVAPRAGFEINQDCPYEYRLVLQDCINKGWINPVAIVKEQDLMWEKLNEAE